MKPFIYFLPSCAYLPVLGQKSMGVVCDFQQTHHITFLKSGNLGPLILGKAGGPVIVRHFIDKECRGLVNCVVRSENSKGMQSVFSLAPAPELRTRPGEVLKGTRLIRRARPSLPLGLQTPFIWTIPTAFLYHSEGASLVSCCYLHSLSLCFLQVPETISGGSNWAG